MAETVPPKSVSGPGSRRAAAVLLGLGTDLAVQVFKQLDEDEVRKLAAGSRELRKAPADAVPEALRGFVEAMERVGGEAAAGDEMLRDVAVQALGNDVVRRVFDGIAAPREPDEVLGSIADADPEALAMVLGREQPQTIALVLSALEPERAAGVMDKLPSEGRAQILQRMATIEAVAPEVLKEVGQALAVELRAVVAGGMRRVDGKSAALALLRSVPSDEQGRVVAAIEENDPTLAAEMKQKLFTFDDVGNLSDRDLQQLLKEIEAPKLTLALKGARPALREKFLKNMSERAALLLSDDLAAIGAVRLSAVEEAQALIASTALDLSTKGKITIVGAADKMV
jgi:flagellar motor switch protein FliG